MEHHAFSPSRLDQLRICPGSYFMQLGLPEEESSEYAAEGTMLHERVAQGGNTDGLDLEQAGLVESCMDFLARLTMNDEVFHEQKLPLHTLDGEELTFGTLDVVIKHQSERLTVIDWKFGYNPVSEPGNNAQLAAYCAAAMQYFNASECTGYVFQPRIRNTSCFTFTNAPAIARNIKAIIDAAGNEDKIILAVTEESCRYCRAKGICPAFQIKYKKFYHLDGHDLENEEVLATLYEESKIIRSHISDIEKAVKNFIEKEGRCDKFVFKTSEGNRQIQNLNELYDRVQDFVTPREFNAICSVSVPKLDSLLAAKIIAASDEKKTKKAAKEEAGEMVADLISRGTPTRKIVEDIG